MVIVFQYVSIVKYRKAEGLEKEAGLLIPENVIGIMICGSNCCRKLSFQFKNLKIKRVKT